MDPTGQTVLTRDIFLENGATGKQLDGLIFAGRGRQVIAAISDATGLSNLDVLDAIVHRLLVQKGADWTSVILSEYLELFHDSSGWFALVWDKPTRQLVAHGCTFGSRAHPWASLLAHIRTLDEFKGLGLGTLVTETVTAGAFERGAKIVVLATDDKLHRLAHGERAAHSMYSKMGYAILGEKRLADTVDWMMVVNEAIFEKCQSEKRAAGGRFPKSPGTNLLSAKNQFVDRIRTDFENGSSDQDIPANQSISPGDLANLFVLLNLCPEDDFRLKLSSWQIHHGPETERNFIATLRQAILDQDRLQDATMVARDQHGAIVAICAAQLQSPFTRHSYAIDFYCLPQFLKSNRTVVVELVQDTIKRIEAAKECPRPCQLVFTGIDSEKCSLFESLKFVPKDHKTEYYGPDGGLDFAASHFVRELA